MPRHTQQTARDRERWQAERGERTTALFALEPMPVARHQIDANTIFGASKSASTQSGDTTD